MYALAKQVIDGKLPNALFLDVLVKTAKPKLVIQTTTRTEAQLKTLMHRIERATEIIEKGAFTPARTDSWQCSIKWCGYATTCPFWSGK
jgi:hypothetical protein